MFQKPLLPSWGQGLRMAGASPSASFDENASSHADCHADSCIAGASPSTAAKTGKFCITSYITRRFFTSILAALLRWRFLVIFYSNGMREAQPAGQITETVIRLYLPHAQCELLSRLKLAQAEICCTLPSATIVLHATSPEVVSELAGRMHGSVSVVHPGGYVMQCDTAHGVLVVRAGVAECVVTMAIHHLLHGRRLVQRRVLIMVPEDEIGGVSAKLLESLQLSFILQEICEPGVPRVGGCTACWVALLLRELPCFGFVAKEMNCRLLVVRIDLFLQG